MSVGEHHNKELADSRRSTNTLLWVIDM